MNWLTYIPALVCLGLPTLMLAAALWDCAKAHKVLKEISKP